MGLRFRKSIKIAPGLKINLNKNSISATVGTKGAHYTINSKGKKTATVGVPGTGLSYTTSSSGKKNKESNTYSYNGESGGGKELSNGGSNKKKRGCLTVFIIIFILGIIGSAFTGDKELESISISANDSKEYDINTEIKITSETNPSDFKLSDEDYKCSSGGSINSDGNTAIFTASEAGDYEVWVEKDDVKSNALTITIVDKATEEAEKRKEEERKKAEEAAAEAQAQAQQPQEQMVWIPSSGSKYHSNSSCGGMSNPTQVTKSVAEARGYTPCKKCY